jgi:hypothetical protein
MAKNNLLTMSPILKPKLTLVSLAGDNSLYQVLIPRTNLLERFSIRYLKQPTHYRVRLDQFGSFVLCHCTGEYPVEQIENLMATEFGITAEPIRERLVTFLSIVEANGWIEWVRT